MLCIPWRCRGSYAQILLNKMKEKMKRLLYIDKLHNNQLSSAMNGNILQFDDLCGYWIKFYTYGLVFGGIKSYCYCKGVGMSS